MGRRIIRAQTNERAAIKIAFCGYPGASLAAPARKLFERYQPITFNGSRISNQVGIGRTGLFDDPDTGQKRLPAAWSVSEPKGPMSR